MPTVKPASWPMRALAPTPIRVVFDGTVIEPRAPWSSTLLNGPAAANGWPAMERILPAATYEEAHARIQRLVDIHEEQRRAASNEIF